MKPRLLTASVVRRFRKRTLLTMRPPYRLSATWYLEEFFRLAQALPLSQAVLDQAVALRQQRKVSLGDALVAGTALVHGLTLVTRNVQDFQWIQGLSLLNPFC